MIGYAGVGKLTITSGGGVTNTYGYLGYESGSIGDVNVDGPASTWKNSDFHYVGCFGDGKLAISNGGQVEDAYSYLGHVSGASGEANVSGSGSKWTSAGFLCVGYSGDGKVAVGHGGLLEDYYGYIGFESGSTGKVTVAGSSSTWANSSELYADYAGDGQLTIADGGSVENTCSYVGYGIGSSGEVVVEGENSTWTNNDSLAVGCSGYGMLLIGSGGTVSVAATLTIDYAGDTGSYIAISSGGTLALFGDADGSLAEFLELIEGSDDIRYWDESLSAWAGIEDAIFGEDYSLHYSDEGDLAGYTLLTMPVMAVPEPASGAALLVLCLAGATIAARRNPRPTTCPLAPRPQSIAPRRAA